MRKHPGAWSDWKESNIIHYKTCSSCNQSKPTNLFHKKKRGKFGVAGICASCANHKYREWVKANPDKKRASDSAYAANNKEKIKAIKERWSARNAEAEKVRKRQNYLDNRQIRNHASLEWAKNNRSKINAYKKEWRKNNPQKTINELARYRDKKFQNGIYKILKKRNH